MAERGNTTHSPHLDDKMKQETQGLVKGNHPTRAEDWRETETMDDGADVAPGAESDEPMGPDGTQPDGEPVPGPEYDPGIDAERGIDPDTDVNPDRGITNPDSRNRGGNGGLQ